MKRLSGFDLILIVFLVSCVVEHLGSEALKVYERTHRTPAAVVSDGGVR